MEGAVSQRIDWDQVRPSGEMVDHMNTVKSHLVPLLNTSHESVQDNDQELKCAHKAVALCAQSRSAHRAWKDQAVHLKDLYLRRKADCIGL